MISSPGLIAPLNFHSGEMLNYQQNAQGVTPAAVAPPNAINPEQELFRHRSDCRRGGGTGTLLFFTVPMPDISYHCKRISQEPDVS